MGIINKIREVLVDFKETSRIAGVTYAAGKLWRNTVYELSENSHRSQEAGKKVGRSMGIWVEKKTGVPAEIVSHLEGVAYGYSQTGEFLYPLIKE